mmetsp:Transcript_65340/g.188209  ORF Transcript_65340/g.188209 Transcript_65340/m.188209 type:complete len:250 (+) Transcript_65340:661-1410(+)
MHKPLPEQSMGQAGIRWYNAMRVHAAPDHPKSHVHSPGAFGDGWPQTPWPLQLPGHCGSRQFGPCQPCWHTQTPSSHVPWSPQGMGQIRCEQSFCSAGTAGSTAGEGLPGGNGGGILPQPASHEQMLPGWQMPWPLQSLPVSRKPGQPSTSHSSPCQRPWHSHLPTVVLQKPWPEQAPPTPQSGPLGAKRFAAICSGESKPTKVATEAMADCMELKKPPSSADPPPRPTADNCAKAVPPGAGREAPRID